MAAAEAECSPAMQAVTKRVSRAMELAGSAVAAKKVLAKGSESAKIRTGLCLHREGVVAKGDVSPRPSCAKMSPLLLLLPLYTRPAQLPSWRVGLPTPPGLVGIGE